MRREVVMSRPVRSMVKEFGLSLMRAQKVDSGSLASEESRLLSLAQMETDDFRFDLPPGWPRQAGPKGVSTRLESFDSARDWLR